MAVEPADPGRFAQVLDGDHARSFLEAVERARGILAGRRVWNVNSTPKGGGVAEMLASLLPYARGAGVDARWLVIGGDDRFFAVTKHIHNRLHGLSGAADGLSASDRGHYESVLAAQAGQVIERLGPGDIVILHDPQTAGLIPALHDIGVSVIWRCHVGVDTPNAVVRQAWADLLPYVRLADRVIFSRREYAWDGLDERRLRVVAPSIDPFSPKNYAMSGTAVQEILGAAGIMETGARRPVYSRVDGRRGRIEHAAAMLESTRLDATTPLVMQVSRWDRLKDPVGVLDAFVSSVMPGSPAHLLLAGPNVQGVDDDPEGAGVYAEVARRWERLDLHARERVHLASLPMDNEQENAVMVNALQRRAQVVVQKSLAEGFGLTVAEAMWKSRPVVASRVGGIQDQIEDGVSGFLLQDPRDHAQFGAAVCALFADGELAKRIGANAHARVQQAFLGSRDLTQYVEICAELTSDPERR
jgi:trehalose synthase